MRKLTKNEFNSRPRLIWRLVCCAFSGPGNTDKGTFSASATGTVTEDERLMNASSCGGSTTSRVGEDGNDKNFATHDDFTDEDLGPRAHRSGDLHDATSSRAPEQAARLAGLLARNSEESRDGDDSRVIDQSVADATHCCDPLGLNTVESAYCEPFGVGNEGLVVIAEAPAPAVSPFVDAPVNQQVEQADCSSVIISICPENEAASALETGTTSLDEDGTHGDGTNNPAGCPHAPDGAYSNGDATSTDGACAPAATTELALALNLFAGVNTNARGEPISLSFTDLGSEGEEGDGNTAVLNNAGAAAAASAAGQHETEVYSA